ncbi:putative F-box domain-containing protein [Rosa chinensis]|uniref:Putative F-box domain-containing protein n=1 Tax=Rosa chinensis TaxID=74649 RepID=A0A2P6QA87_ROSCH|nr:putative F-box domain-containing protein [Rosa chinensis]
MNDHRIAAIELKSEEGLDYFPQEIISNILIRLPIKSLIKCTSVCKSWKSLIQNPSFIDAHLSQLCLVDELGCHGYNLIIWNPCIRKFVDLPEPAVLRGGCDASIGFGYDAISNDYKVVRLVSLSDQYQNFHGWPTLFQVYSLATGSWSRLCSDLPQCQMFCSPAQAFVNGALHWSAIHRTNDTFNYFVLAFYVGSEWFREIMFPKSLKWDPTLALRISVSGDGKSIAVFTDWRKSHTDYFLDIWVLKEYCMENSWTKLMILSAEVPQRNLPKAMCFRKIGEVLVLEDSYELVSLDIMSRKVKILGVYGGQYFSVDSCEESLVLLDRKYGVSWEKSSLVIVYTFGFLLFLVSFSNVYAVNSV